MIVLRDWIIIASPSDVMIVFVVKSRWCYVTMPKSTCKANRTPNPKLAKLAIGLALFPNGLMDSLWLDIFIWRVCNVCATGSTSCPLGKTLDIISSKVQSSGRIPTTILWRSINRPGMCSTRWRTSSAKPNAHIWGPHPYLRSCTSSCWCWSCQRVFSMCIDAVLWVLRFSLSLLL